MAIPTPRSFNVIVGEMLDAFLSRVGLSKIRPGSPLLTIMMSAAQSDMRNAKDIFDLLNASSLDSATGVSLDRIGADELCPRLGEYASSGLVTVVDASFDKISSKIYQGQPAPIPGIGYIYVVDASLFPSTGEIYLGRGTNNYEGPLTYSAVTDHTTYYEITLVTTPQKIHNAGETVIVAQGGDRVVSAGTTVQTPQGNTQEAVKFSVLYDATVPDGETTIEGVQVLCQTPGVIGNIPAGAINEFTTSPFSGAAASNPLPYSNGQSIEDDAAYRERIRLVRQSRTKGTSTAITTAVQGISSSDENRRISSASLVKRLGLPTTLYIDDGTGYEEKSEGIPFETLVDSANGGEQYFQIAEDRPVTKAFVETTLTSPFALSDNSVLVVEVGGVESTHYFSDDDFRNINSATAYEVVSSINAEPSLLFAARTSDGGTKVILESKEDTNEDLVVSSPIGTLLTDANEALMFPSNKSTTMWLYKNDRLLSKDGQVASLTSNSIDTWVSSSLISGVTFTINVDGTGAATYTIVDADFINAGTGYTTVARNTVDAWIDVINYRVPGITATENNGLITITSNSQNTDKASIAITSCGLTSANMFEIEQSQGFGFDYSLDRNTGQIRLEEVLEANDRLTIGSVNNRAFMESSALSSTALTTDARLWFSFDGNTTLIDTGINSALDFTVSVVGTRPDGLRVRITCTSGETPFLNVSEGDSAILWDANLSSSLRGIYLVSQVHSGGTWFEIDYPHLTSARFSAATVLLQDGRVMVTGGKGFNEASLDTCEIFDPVTNTWSATKPMATPRAKHQAVVLNDGTVMVLGGVDLSTNYLTSCEIYDSATDVWTTVSSMSAGLFDFHAFVLDTDEVVVIGGETSTALNSNVLVYTPSTDVWSTVAGPIVDRRYHMACALVGTPTKVMICGGRDYALTTVYNTGEVFTLAGGWVAIAPSTMTTAVYSGYALVHQATGIAYIFGGTIAGGANYTGTQSFNFAGLGTFANTGFSIASAPSTHSGIPTIDANGICYWGYGSPNTIERFNPASGWSFVATPIVSVDTYEPFSMAYDAGKAIFGGGYTNNYINGYWPNSDTIICNNGSPPTLTVVDNGLTQTTFNLASSGMAFATNEGPISPVTVPGGGTYTASNFANSIDAQISGADSSVYRTSTVRVRTNTFNLDGGTSLIANDSSGSLLLIDTGSSTNSDVPSHMAFVESGNSDINTPQFGVGYVNGYTSDNGISVSYIEDIPFNSQLVGLERFDFSILTASPITRFGNNRYLKSIIATVYNYEKNQTLYLRDSSVMEPWERFYISAPYVFGSEDSLVVVADQDSVSKRYSVPMFRRLTPVGSHIGTIEFMDDDHGGTDLTEVFGTSFDFKDFALYMPARTVSHTDAAVTTSSILWRYSRLGPDGELARLHYVYPDSASSALAIETDFYSYSSTDINVILPSGTAKTLTQITSTCKLGIIRGAAVAGRNRVFVVAGLPVASATRELCFNYHTKAGGNFSAGSDLFGSTSGLHPACVTTDTVTSPATSGRLSLVAGTTAFHVTETITEIVGGVPTGVSATVESSYYGYITLALTLPSAIGPVGITNHGFVDGNTVWFQSTDEILFPSRDVTIVAHDSVSISYTDSDTTNITLLLAAGTVSNADQEITFTSGTPVLVGDLIRFGSGTSLPSTMEDITYRITVIANQYLVFERTEASAAIPFAWYSLTDSSELSIFPLSLASCTATAIKNSVNALTNSPVTATLLGSGAGTISMSTDDEYGTADLDHWYEFTDGVNWISAQTDPPTALDNYTFTLKQAQDIQFQYGCDWENEDVRLVPVTADHISRWMNVVGVTSLSNTCEICTSSQNHNVQISSLTIGSDGAVQIQGGSANAVNASIVDSAQVVDSTYSVVSIDADSDNGFIANSYVKIQNYNKMSKSILNTNTALQSISTSGYFLLDGGTDVFTYVGSVLSGFTWKIERQGKFVCYSLRFDNSSASISATEGNWVRISQPSPGTSPIISSSNSGSYRVVRTQNDTNVRAFWIENDSAIDEEATANVRFFTSDSLMPGDTISINTELWGVDNVGGQWIVTEIGSTSGIPAEYSNQHAFRVEVTDNPITANGAAAILGSQLGLVRIEEASPATLYKKIVSIVPNNDDADYVDIKFNSSNNYASISESAGSIMYAMDKLDFDTDLFVGTDGYSHSTGLIGEANKVVYGDPSDPSTYPGVIAEGASINIAGPMVKRITVAISLRVRSGVPTASIAERVRSTVAGIVNKSGVGQDLALSAIVAAASKVSGVVAVVITDPIYNSSNDLISVQPYEKPMVLDINQDISVSFIGVE